MSSISGRRAVVKLLGLAPFIMGMTRLKDLEKLAEGLAYTSRMPVIFVGHGNPMNAIEENEFVQGFREIAASIEKPKAILCISAHYYTRGTRVTISKAPPTIHDFGGFPKELYDVQYPAPGYPDLAKETVDLLSPTEVILDEEWGLDHGAWTVIKHFYPEADVPVIELSIDYTKHASYHYDLAARLSSLRDKGILIIGSGNIIHNLKLVDFQNINNVGYGYDWAQEVREKSNQLLLDGNFKALINYPDLGAAFQLAIPTPDHYLPLIYTLGLHRSGEEVCLFNDELLAGSLSMTGVKISSY